MDHEAYLNNNELHTAGLLLFAGTLILMFCMMLAEFTYPGYSVAHNYISDLGNFSHTIPALLFNVSTIMFGAITVYAGFLVKKSLDRWLGIFIILAGAGQIGVGVFNEGTILAIHVICALIVFVSGAIAILWSAKVLYRPPVSFIFLILGGISVFFLLLLIINSAPGSPGIIRSGIGVGGMERMVVFPIIFWSLATGIYLLGREETRDPAGERPE